MIRSRLKTTPRPRARSEAIQGRDLGQRIATGPLRCARKDIGRVINRGGCNGQGDRTQPSGPIRQTARRAGGGDGPGEPDQRHADQRHEQTHVHDAVNHRRVWKGHEGSQVA